MSNTRGNKKNNDYKHHYDYQDFDFLSTKKLKENNKENNQTNNSDFNLMSFYFEMAQQIIDSVSLSHKTSQDYFPFKERHEIRTTSSSTEESIKKGMDFIGAESMMKFYVHECILKKIRDTAEENIKYILQNPNLSSIDFNSIPTFLPRTNNTYDMRFLTLYVVILYDAYMNCGEAALMAIIKYLENYCIQPIHLITIQNDSDFSFNHAFIILGNNLPPLNSIFDLAKLDDSFILIDPYLKIKAFGSEIWNTLKPLIDFDALASIFTITIQPYAATELANFKKLAHQICNKLRFDIELSNNIEKQKELLKADPLSLKFRSHKKAKPNFYELDIFSQQHLTPGQLTQFSFFNVTNNQINTQTNNESKNKEGVFLETETKTNEARDSENQSVGLQGSGLQSSGLQGKI